MKLATLVYIEKDGKMLMMFRDKKKNDMHERKYNGIGGKLEEGESPEECMIRETQEETGLTPTNFRLAGISTYPQFYENEDWYLFIYHVTAYQGEEFISSEGSLEWIKTSLLSTLNMWEDNKIFLQWLLEKTFFSSKFIYETDTPHPTYTVNFYENKKLSL